MKMQSKKYDIGNDEKIIHNNIENVLEENVYNYCNIDIYKLKQQITEKIKHYKNNTYKKENFTKKKYDIRLSTDIFNLSTYRDELQYVIQDIKQTYIYEEAILQLVNENKLIPVNVDVLREDSKVILDFVGGGMSCYEVVLLDKIVFTEFRVSKTIYSEK